jgi:UDP-2,3-diacylglucosamine hydrolase
MMRKPYWLRRGVAAYLRLRSRRANAMKPEAIMDVNDAAVAKAFRTHKVSRIVHGHTHRPATHRHDVDGRTCERIVLADWHDDGSYLEIDEDGVRTREIRGAQL